MLTANGNFKVKQFLVLLALLFCETVATSQIIVNGDLNGPITGISSTPTSWMQIPNTDPLSNATSLGSATSDLGSTILPTANLSANPYSGGTFVSGLYASTGGTLVFDEGIMQEVFCLTPGTTYEIRFYQGVKGQPNTVDTSGSWAVYIDNNLAGVAPISINSVPYFNGRPIIWGQRSVFFTATATSHFIKFMVQDDDPISLLSNFDENGALRMAIDSISLIGPGSATAQNLLGPDTTVCNTVNYTLTPPTNGTSYLWQDNSTAPTYNVTQPGTYWVQMTLAGGCVVSDTVNVNLISGSVDLGMDTTLCPGDSLLLDATLPGATYTWQDGTTIPTYWVTQPGAYLVNIQYGSCTIADSITVSYDATPNIDLGPDTTVCSSQQLVLDATFPNGTYLWQDNSANAMYNATASGTYWVEVSTLAGCSASDTINVTFVPLQNPSLGPDTSLCAGDILVLNAPSTGLSTWQDGSNNATFTVQQGGTYWVDVSLGACLATDTIVVQYNSPLLFDLGPDTLICEPNTITFSVPGAPGMNYVWQDNSTNASFVASQAGTYFVSVSNNGCMSYDTINLQTNQLPVAQIGPDTTLCPGETLVLDATTPNVTYLWQNGATAPQYQVTQTGQYFVDVTNNCGTVTDTINVVYISLPINYLGNDTSVCDWAGITLNVNIPGSQTQWQDNTISNSYAVNTPGTYTATTTIQGCVTTDDITIGFNSEPEVNLGPDQSHCEIDQLLLINFADDPGTYIWNTGSVNNQIQADTFGVYSVLVTNQCGSGGDTIRIESLNCYCDVYVPNTFTPNNDEHNSLFGPKYDCIFIEYNFRIFNRWGEMIWESNDPDTHWDGTYQNRKVQDGVYVYQMRYSSEYVSEEIYTGHVNVLR